jgi:exodeoxyribonuclease VII large subunit
VVSAVGHEIDITISDMASDFRAPTPSAAAELLVAEKEDLSNRVNDLRHRLASIMAREHRRCLADLENLKGRLRDPRRRLVDAWLHLDDVQQRLIRMMRLSLHHEKMSLGEKTNALRIFSPQALLASRRQHLDFQQNALVRAMRTQLRGLEMHLTLMQKGLKDLNPMSILGRGYSIAFHLPEQRILRETAGVRKGDRVMVLLEKGRLTCRVESTEADSGL